MALFGRKTTRPRPTYDEKKSATDALRSVCYDLMEWESPDADFGSGSTFKPEFLHYSLTNGYHNFIVHYVRYLVRSAYREGVDEGAARESQCQQTNKGNTMPKQHWKPVQIAHGAHYVDITASRNDYLHGAPSNQDWRVLWAARESLHEQRTYRTDFGVVQDTPPDVAYIVPCLRVYVKRPQDRVAVERVVLQAARQVLGDDAECDIRMYPEARPAAWGG